MVEEDILLLNAQIRWRYTANSPNLICSHQVQEFCDLYNWSCGSSRALTNMKKHFVSVLHDVCLPVIHLVGRLALITFSWNIWNEIFTIVLIILHHIYCEPNMSTYCKGCLCHSSVLYLSTDCAGFMVQCSGISTSSGSWKFGSCCIVLILK